MHILCKTPFNPERQEINKLICLLNFLLLSSNLKSKREREIKILCLLKFIKIY